MPDAPRWGLVAGREEEQEEEEEEEFLNAHLRGCELAFYSTIWSRALKVWGLGFRFRV
jgi:hypothetical protein